MLSAVLRSLRDLQPSDGDGSREGNTAADNKLDGDGKGRYEPGCAHGGVRLRCLCCCQPCVRGTSSTSYLPLPSACVIDSCGAVAQRPAIQATKTAAGSAECLPMMSPAVMAVAGARWDAWFAVCVRVACGVASRVSTEVLPTTTGVAMLGSHRARQRETDSWCRRVIIEVRWVH